MRVNAILAAAAAPLLLGMSGCCSWCGVDGTEPKRTGATKTQGSVTRPTVYNIRKSGALIAKSLQNAGPPVDGKYSGWVIVDAGRWSAVNGSAPQPNPTQAAVNACFAEAFVKTADDASGMAGMTFACVNHNVIVPNGFKYKWTGVTEMEPVDWTLTNGVACDP